MIDRFDKMVKKAHENLMKGTDNCYDCTMMPADFVTHVCRKHQGLLVTWRQLAVFTGSEGLS